MPAPKAARAAFLFVFLALAGCGGGLGAPEVAALDGLWEGRGLKIDGPTLCPGETRLRLAIQNGGVRGEAWDPRSPDAVATFESFLELDGRMFADAFVGGDRLRLSGQFARSSFAGQSTSRRGCVQRVAMTRAR